MNTTFQVYLENTEYTRKTNTAKSCSLSNAHVNVGDVNLQ